MHRWLLAVVVLALSLPAIAQDRGGGAPQGRGGDAPQGPPGGRGAPPRPAAGNGIEVGGWSARLDDPKESRTGLKFVTMGTGLHATTGPTVILYDPEEDWEGPYTTKATLTMTKPASHQVAYGLFVGGQDLDTDKQRYTYFVIRQDGKFLIRKRTGATTANVAGDWMDHAAIQKPNAQGGQTNELAIRVARDAVTFLVNGQTIATHPTSAVDAVGISGLRIGHGLDVHIEGFSVEQVK
ncbi:MAG TPA: hypothetical protein VI485_13940 [Vicinamibacterales bacterium]|nr:hypothetical protein [Vicinamibacterales bacterium]